MAGLLLLLADENPLALLRFFVQQWPNADATGLRPEMTAQSVGTSETAATAPLSASREIPTTDKFLFPGMQTFMSFPIVLARKGFAADCADKRSFIGVGPQVGAQVVRPRKALRTKVTLEGGRVLLHPFGIIG